MNQDDKELQLQVQSEIAEIIPDSMDETFEGLSLNPQEMLFAYHLVETNDNIEAHRKAFGVMDYKKALAQSSRLAKKKDVVEACKRLRDAIWDRAQQVLPVKLLQQLDARLNIDPLDYFEADGTARLLDAIPKEKRLLMDPPELMFNSKTGERFIMYKYPTRDSAIKMLIDLVKIRGITNTGGEDKNTMGEAQAKINEIFGNIGKIDETNK